MGTANLTWFEIVSGDGWSILGRPLIEHFHWPALFFIACVIIIVWGLLGVITAAIVDASIFARENDTVVKAKTMVAERLVQYTFFLQLFKTIEDENGNVTSSKLRLL